MKGLVAIFLLLYFHHKNQLNVSLPQPPLPKALDLNATRYVTLYLIPWLIFDSHPKSQQERRARQREVQCNV